MPTRLDVILVVDVESTCWEKAPPAGQASDIIEIGVTTLDFMSLKRIDKRSLMVKPARSTVGEFCTRLTTITPEDVATAGSLADACTTLRTELKSKDRLWASWGNYDRKQFQENCDALGVPYPFGSDHLNAKALFSLLRKFSVVGIPIIGN